MRTVSVVVGVAIAAATATFLVTSAMPRATEPVHETRVAFARVGLSPAGEATTAAAHRHRTRGEFRGPLHKTGDPFFVHISDTHVDPFFTPFESMAMKVCHPCKFSSRVFGPRAYCPLTLPPSWRRIQFDDTHPFGRLGCNPPYRILHSVFAAIKELDAQPPFIVVTGDLAPHGYPDDLYQLKADTKLSDLCGTKAVIMDEMLRLFRAAFPNTTWVYATGNNDHFPKDVFWPPWMNWLGDALRRHNFIDDAQHATYVQHGSIRYNVGGIAFLSFSLSIFMPRGEQFTSSPYAVREAVVRWTATQLADARRTGTPVYLVGHQPMSTKGGAAQLEEEGAHYVALKKLFAEYRDTIKLALFGDRNVAGFYNVLSPANEPVVPSITVPGVSPRGVNFPAFHLLTYDRTDKVITDFTQHRFDIIAHNAKVVELRNAGKHEEANAYLGSWEPPSLDDTLLGRSWREFTNTTRFTADALQAVLESTASSSDRMVAAAMWKRAGYVGGETPEGFICRHKFDDSEEVRRCIFRDQDPRCWVPGWVKA